MNLASLGMSAAQGLSGAIMGEVGSVIGELTGSRKRKEQQQIAQQQKLTDMQLAANKDAANYSQQLQREMFNHTFKTTSEYNSPEATMKRMREAGLNPAMAYGMSGAGGGTGQGQIGGAGASGVGAGAADSPTATRMADLQTAQMGLNLENLKSQIKVNEAQAFKTAQEGNKVQEEVITTIESRDPLVQKLIEDGKGQWLENIKREWEMEHSGRKDDPNELTLNAWGNHIYGMVEVLGDSLYNRSIVADITKAYADTRSADSSATANMAMAALTNEKTKYYWQEILIAMKDADTKRIMANAQKLATEWNTGEYTNWKTWVGAGADVLNGAAKAIISK